jgi:hypothetical protein
MTSRERFGAWYTGRTVSAYEIWQAAERDMLERCIKVVNGYTGCDPISDKLEELLNEPR